MTLPPHLNYNGKQVLLKYHKCLTGLKTAPPNSLQALEQVIEGGARAIEFDVSVSADGVFVLLHDATLERETTGVGPLRRVTLEQVKGLRLRGTDIPPAALDEVVARLRTVERPLKVQVDLKELEPLEPGVAATLVKNLRPLLEKPNLTLVVGCLGDWNLRILHRLEPGLGLGIDFAYHLDAAVDELIRLPMRLNAYGYLDDHPLGFRRLLSTRDYLMDRVETLMALVPTASEFYLRKEFVRQAREDGFDAIGFIHAQRPDALVDVWTLDRSPDGSRDAEMHALLEAGADQVTTNTAVQWAEALSR